MKKKKILSTMFLTLFILATSIIAFADNDDCTPSWAPFWKTSCTYTGFDQNGELIMYKKTCRHFIFTTSCSVEAKYDI